MRGVEGGGWGDEATLIAAAARYGVKICTVSSLEGQGAAHEYAPAGGAERGTLVLGHLHQFHWVSTAPRGDPPGDGGTTGNDGDRGCAVTLDVHLCCYRLLQR